MSVQAEQPSVAQLLSEHLHSSHIYTGPEVATNRVESGRGDFGCTLPTDRRSEFRVHDFSRIPEFDLYENARNSLTQH